MQQLDTDSPPAHTTDSTPRSTPPSTLHAAVGVDASDVPSNAPLNVLTNAPINGNTSPLEHQAQLGVDGGGEGGGEGGDERGGEVVVKGVVKDVVKGVENQGPRFIRYANNDDDDGGGGGGGGDGLECTCVHVLFLCLSMSTCHACMCTYHSPLLPSHASPPPFTHRAYAPHTHQQNTIQRIATMMHACAQCLSQTTPSATPQLINAILARVDAGRRVAVWMAAQPARPTQASSPNLSDVGEGNGGEGKPRGPYLSVCCALGMVVMMMLRVEGREVRGGGGVVIWCVCVCAW